MKMRICYLAVAMLLTGPMSVFALPGVPAAVTPNTTSGVGPQADQVNGWQFTANAPLEVTHLGAWDDQDDGFAESYPVGLFRVSDQALLADVTLSAGTGDPLEDHFRYVELATSVHLADGEDYVVALYNASNPGGGLFLSSIASDMVTFDSNISSVLFRREIGGGGLVFPDDVVGSPTSFLVGPTFRVVPEPSACALLTVGLVGMFAGRRRRSV